MDVCIVWALCIALYCITGASTFSGETENEFNLLSLFQ